MTAKRNRELAIITPVQSELLCRYSKIYILQQHPSSSKRIPAPIQSRFAVGPRLVVFRCDFIHWREGDVIDPDTTDRASSPINSRLPLSPPCPLSRLADFNSSALQIPRAFEIKIRSLCSYGLKFPLFNFEKRRLFTAAGCLM